GGHTRARQTRSGNCRFEPFGLNLFALLMKYYIIAGEASGDLHGSGLMRAIHKLDSQANIRFWGGDLMLEAGGTMVKHYRELAFMGFAEVLMNLRTILRNIDF